MTASFERRCVGRREAWERSGHTAVVDGGDLLYVWGGYTSIDEEEMFLPNNEIWVYDLHTGVWEVFGMIGEVPPPMSGSCGCPLNGHMYIFGGCDDNGQTNQMFCVDLTDGKYTWRRITSELGAPPSPRDKLSCWVYNERLIYFGGYGHKQLSEVDSRNRSFVIDETSLSADVFLGWNNEVHIFDLVQATWSEQDIQGPTPAPRAAHASATLGSRGYICGGRVMETRTSDIHFLDLKTWTWTEIIPSSSTPVGRSWHTLTAVSEKTLFLFGGLSVNCKPMSDGWLLNVDTETWTKHKHPFEDKPRLWHTASQGKNGDVVVFGGSCDSILLVDKGHCNDVLIFQMEPRPLFRICEDYIAKNVWNSDMLRNQLPLLPLKLLNSVQRRTSFYKPSNMQVI